MSQIASREAEVSYHPTEGFFAALVRVTPIAQLQLPRICSDLLGHAVRYKSLGMPNKAGQGRYGLYDSGGKRGSSGEQCEFRVSTSCQVSTKLTSFRAFLLRAEVLGSQ